MEQPLQSEEANTASLDTMPHSRARPSDIAAEAKRHFIPLILNTMPEHPSYSFLHADSSAISVGHDRRSRHRLRVAVIDGDPVDVTLGWSDAVNAEPSTISDLASADNYSHIPIVNMANERRPGGDWESGLIAPEECLARRSNLIATLRTAAHSYAQPLSAQNQHHYPLPQTGGLYSPSVGKHRLL